MTLYLVNIKATIQVCDSHVFKIKLCKSEKSKLKIFPFEKEVKRFYEISNARNNRLRNYYHSHEF